MSLSAAWKPLHNVGASGREGSDAAPCSDAKIRCSIRRRQPARRTTGDTILSEIRCHHVLGLSKEIAPAPAIEPAPCPDSRQCSLSPRHSASTLSCGKAQCSIALISSAIQPRVESSGKGLEAGEKAMYTQSILSAAQRSDRGCNTTARAVE